MDTHRGTETISKRKTVRETHKAREKGIYYYFLLNTTNPSHKTNKAIFSLVASYLFYLTFDGSQLLYCSALVLKHPGIT